MCTTNKIAKQKCSRQQKIIKQEKFNQIVKLHVDLTMLLTCVSNDKFSSKVTPRTYICLCWKLQISQAIEIFFITKNLKICFQALSLWFSTYSGFLMRVEISSTLNPKWWQSDQSLSRFIIYHIFMEKCRRTLWTADRVSPLLYRVPRGLRQTFKMAVFVSKFLKKITNIDFIFCNRLMQLQLFALSDINLTEF